MNTHPLQVPPTGATGSEWQEVLHSDEENPSVVWQESQVPKGNLHLMRPLKGKAPKHALRPLPGKLQPLSRQHESPTPGFPDGASSMCAPALSTSELQPPGMCSGDPNDAAFRKAAYSIRFAGPDTSSEAASQRPTETRDTTQSPLRDAKGRRPSYDVISREERKLEILERVGSYKGNPASLNPLLPQHPASANSEVVLSKTEEEFLRVRRVSLASMESDSQEAALARTSSDDNSKARWAKAHWYAMQKAGGAQEKSHRNVSDEEGEKFAKVVNTLVYAMHWRQKALGPGTGENAQEAGGKSPGLGRRGGVLAGAMGWAVVVPSLLRWAATLFILVGWDLNVVLDSSGAADTPLRAAASALLLAFALDAAARLARGTLRLRSTEALLDLASCLSLLPDALVLVGGPEAPAQVAAWAVWVRALRAGFRMSARAGAVGLLLHAAAERQRQEGLPESVRPDADPDTAAPPRARAALSAHVDAHTVMVAGAVLAAHAAIATVWPQSRLDPEHGAAAFLALLCHQHAAGTASAAAALAAVEGWGLPVRALRVCGEDLLPAPPALREFPSAVVAYGARSGACECGLEVDASEAARAEAAGRLVLTCAVVAGVFFAGRRGRGRVEREVAGPLEELQHRVLEMLRKPMRTYHTPDTAPVREALVVERAACRMTRLLRVSLGEAGGKVVAANLTEGVSIDRSMPGKIVNGIFGFCDIRNFTDLTEVLQAEVTQLVNTVALHVHEAVARNYGAPNKNIGDAFLLVWKPNRGRQVEEVADAALLSLVQSVAALRRCPDLSRLAARPDVQQRLPGYQVHMGFGLHYGWATEGAIGSSRKIDASYLSPHVNLAARLESATKQYGVPMLLSESVRTLLSPPVQASLRLLDRVVLKGASQPLRLYTFDVWDLHPAPARASSDASSTLSLVAGASAGRRLSVKAREALEPASDAEYRRDFGEAVEWYLGGEGGQHADWVKASALLKDCWSRCPQDGAAKALLEVIRDMAGPGGMQPRDWQGFRHLTEK